MKKGSAIMTFINRTLPHILLVIACMILTFLIINEFNSAMQFLTNDITIALLFALAVVGGYVAVISIYYQRKLYKARVIMREMQNYINENIPEGKEHEEV